jgi:hypothetical protein
MKFFNEKETSIVTNYSVNHHFFSFISNYLDPNIVDLVFIHKLDKLISMLG